MTSMSGAATASNPPARPAYLDVVRGLAVLIMVLAHVVDSWTREADRHDFAFYTAVFVGGLGAPLFMFLAGVAQVMSASARARRSDDHHAGTRAMWRRGWDVFVLAWLFRLQSQLLGWGALINVLRVDILNVMGLSMMVAALIWGSSATRARRILGFALSAAVATFATPIIRATPWLAVLPDPIEAYIRPAGGYAAFTMFPWAGFLLAGAIVGELVDATRTETTGTRLQVWLAIAGLSGALLGWWASFRPSIYASSSFWTSSPTFFFIKLGIVTALVPATWAHCRFWLAGSAGADRLRQGSGESAEALRAKAEAPALCTNREQTAGDTAVGPRHPGVVVTRAVELLGRSSLFVYWIHVEMVYGVIAEPLKRMLPLWGSLAATLVLSWLLLLIVRAKNRRMEGVALPPRARIVAAVLR